MIHVRVTKTRYKLEIHFWSDYTLSTNSTPTVYMKYHIYIYIYICLRNIMWTPLKIVQIIKIQNLDKIIVSLVVDSLLHMSRSKN